MPVCRAVVGIHVANLNRCAVGLVYDSAVGSTQHSLGLAVAIPVVSNDVVLVVLEIGHVRSQVNPPQPLSVELIYLDDGILTVVSSFLPTPGYVFLVVKLQ